MGMLNGADISVAKYIRESILPSFIGNSEWALGAAVANVVQ